MGLYFRIVKLERIQPRSAEVTRSPGNMIYKANLEELRLFSLVKKRVRMVLTVFKYLKAGYTEDGNRLFSVPSENNTGNNGLKFQQAKFSLVIGKNFLTLRLFKQATWRGCGNVIIGNF